ncbi:tetratricopeptide repeat protein [bacterium]|nr:tetratricopeptide repeat protein [bacterium]
MIESKEYFRNLAAQPDHKISLAEAALQIALDEYPELDISHYKNLLKGWSTSMNAKFSRKRIRNQLEEINQWLFREMSFTGNIENYYDPRNSFLNDVMDRRTGIPITLSIIYLEMAWALGMSAAGVGFPGHFLVRVMDDAKPVYIDPFHQGNIMTAQECVEFLNEITEGELKFDQKFLSAVNKKEIIVRMLRNLKRIYIEMSNYSKLINILDHLVVITAGEAEEIRDRGIIYYQMKAFKNALHDFETFLSIAPDSEDAEVIQQYLQVLQEYDSHLN